MVKTAARSPVSPSTTAASLTNSARSSSAMVALADVDVGVAFTTLSSTTTNCWLNSKSASSSTGMSIVAPVDPLRIVNVEAVAVSVAAGNSTLILRMNVDRHILLQALGGRYVECGDAGAFRDVDIANGKCWGVDDRSSCVPACDRGIAHIAQIDMEGLLGFDLHVRFTTTSTGVARPGANVSVAATAR